MKLTGHTILCYGLNTEKGKKIKTAALLLGIRVKSVDASRYGEAIGSLLGKPVEVQEETEEEQGVQISEEMMVMAGFNSRTLDHFLEQLKRRGIPGVVLKAVVTPHNVSWSSRRLYRELCGEREAYRQGNAVPEATGGKDESDSND